VTFMKRPKTDQERIDHEAAQWVVTWEDREYSHAPKEQSRWFGWLQRSPRHLQSYLDTADLYERLGRIDPDSKIDVDEWIAARRAPVVSIAKPSADQVLQNRSASAVSTRWQWGAVAASLMSIAVIASWSIDIFGPPSYRTEVGQQSISRLEDGSIVNLNTRSRAKVRFSDTQRVVELEGEAMFTVAKDATRPFFVRTRGATIRAVGTMFNVYEREADTRVAVVEGTVRVSSFDSRARTATPAVPAQTNIPTLSADESVALSAGEAARIFRGEIAKVQAPDIDAEVAWQKQKLVFEDVPLATVAAEFNRYNEGQLRIQGPIGEAKRLSGTFDALQPQSLLLYLQKDESVTVEPSGDDFVVRAR
jgi:transmembrane sensor